MRAVPMVARIEEKQRESVRVQIPRTVIFPENSIKFVGSKAEGVVVSHQAEGRDLRPSEQVGNGTKILDLPFVLRFGIDQISEAEDAVALRRTERFERFCDLAQGLAVVALFAGDLPG